MKIAIGCDHGGYALKEHLVSVFSQQGYEFIDFGTNGPDSVDYPQFGFAVGEAVADGRCERGVVICSTGIGVSIAANKVRGVRCALCTEPYSAKMCRRHNNANVLALGARVTGVGLAEDILAVFLTEEHEGGRHERRVCQLDDYNGL